MDAVGLFRWGNTPLDDAMQFGHDAVVSVLKEHLRVLSDETHSAVEKQRSDAGDGEKHRFNQQDDGSVMETLKT